MMSEGDGLSIAKPGEGINGVHDATCCVLAARKVPLISQVKNRAVLAHPVGGIEAFLRLSLTVDHYALVQRSINSGRRMTDIAVRPLDEPFHVGRVGMAAIMLAPGQLP